MAEAMGTWRQFSSVSRSIPRPNGRTVAATQSTSSPPVSGSGYEDPRWMTYKQAADSGWQVRKGEKGTQIEFWEIKSADREDQPNSPGNPNGGESSVDANADRSRFIHRVYTVFNAKQIDNIPDYAPAKRSEFEAIQAGEQILVNSGAKITHDQPDRAFYSRAQDSIHLPPKDAFKDVAGNHGTPLHEQAHWTGHANRLNRPTLNESYRFGDLNYAREELRAELASVFLAAERGIPHDPGSTPLTLVRGLRHLRRIRTRFSARRMTHRRRPTSCLRWSAIGP